MNLAENLYHSAEKHPDKTLIYFHDRRITYGHLRRDVARLAHTMSQKGIGPGSRVAIALPNVPEFALATYAAYAAGAEIVSINPLYTAFEMNYMLSDARPALVVTHPLFDPVVLEAVKPLGIPVIYSDNLGDATRKTLADWVGQGKPTFEPAPRDDNDTATILYTNAVSGHPLGAQLTHGGLDFDAWASSSAAAVTEEDYFLTVIPLYHAFSATACLHLPIRQGGSTVFHETFSEKRVIEDLRKYPIALFPAVPTIFKKLLEVFGDKELDFSSVRGFIPGGAPCPVSLIEAMKEKFNANVYEGYGITECGPVTTVNPVAKGISKPGTTGPPLEKIEVKVIDDNGRELPPETEGELCVRGKNVMAGYLHRPEETAHYLRDGWLHTGDFARIDDEGFVTITGLKKRMILVGGFNVYPAEVEIALRRHPAVREAEVYAVPDDTLGSRVAARVAAEEETGKTELQRFLRTYLAPYKVPRIIEFD